MKIQRGHEWMISEDLYIFLWQETVWNKSFGTKIIFEKKSSASCTHHEVYRGQKWNLIAK